MSARTLSGFVIYSPSYPIWEEQSANSHQI